jgi:hypothetical protein
VAAAAAVDAAAACWQAAAACSSARHRFAAATFASHLSTAFLPARPPGVSRHSSSLCRHKHQSVSTIDLPGLVQHPGTATVDSIQSAAGPNCCLTVLPCGAGCRLLSPRLLETGGIGSGIAPAHTRHQHFRHCRPFFPVPVLQPLHEAGGCSSLCICKASKGRSATISHPHD